jgi:hypothetical protein
LVVAVVFGVKLASSDSGLGALVPGAESLERKEIAQDQNAEADSGRKSLSTFAEFAFALAQAAPLVARLRGLPPGFG